MSELRGLNMTCFVCGYRYDSEKHLTQCVNGTNRDEYTDKPSDLTWFEYAFSLGDQCIVDLTVGDHFIDDE